jgi:hypothetical protein
MSSSPPPSVERLIQAGKKGSLKYDFLAERPHAHEARILFLSVLDEEWPELKRDLFHRCWPLFQEACSPFAAMTVGDQPELAIPVLARRGAAFLIPMQLLSFRHLELSDDFEDLRQAFMAWSHAGRGIRDEWFIESAFHTLRSAAPASKDKAYDGSDEPWLYPFEGTYPHRWPPPAQLVDSTVPPSVIRKARREYLKKHSQRFQVPKDMSSDHARWTVARLSDSKLSWADLVDRFHALKRYSEGISEAKRRVRRFAKWIDLSLEDGA